MGGCLTWIVSLCTAEVSVWVESRGPNRCAVSHMGLWVSEMTEPKLREEVIHVREKVQMIEIPSIPIK